MTVSFIWVWLSNRKLQLQHDLLVDQISFLSLDRPSLDGSSSIGLVPNLSIDLDRTITRDESKFFESDEEEPSVKEKIVIVIDKNIEEKEDKLDEEEHSKLESSEKENDESLNVEEIPEDVCEEVDGLEHDQSNSGEQDLEFNAQLLSTENDVESGPLTSTPLSTKLVEQKSQEVQTPPFPLNSKRKKRTALLNVKRTKKPILIPVLPGQRFVPVVSEDVVGDSLKVQHRYILITIFEVRLQKGNATILFWQYIYRGQRSPAVLPLKCSKFTM